MGSRSISTQIRRTVIGTASFAVVVTAIVMLLIMSYVSRSTAQDRAQSLAQVIANNAAGVIALQDHERANELVQALGKMPNLAAARIVDARGQEVAAYAQRSVAPEVLSGERVGNLVVARQRVAFGGEDLGAVDVAIDPSVFSEAPMLFTSASLAIILLLIFLVWAIARPLEDRISRPLLNFSLVTRRIRETKDFTLRVQQSNTAELRSLTDDFNAMLQEVQKVHNDAADRNENLAKLAYYDSLTGAANRSKVYERLETLVREYGTERKPFAVIGIDLDNFKILNDTLGHHAGDAFLKELSRRCLAVLRSTDVFGRMGGDEFIAIVQDVKDHDFAHQVALKLAREVKRANKIHELDTKCTASVGVGLFPHDGQTAQEILARVDAAMYRAKSEGRDLVMSVAKGAIPQPQTSAERAALITPVS